MDVAKYISSGILEQYVLGDLSEKDRREVERYAEQYPEIRQELDSIETAMEAFALSRSTPPSPGTLNKVLERIQQPVPANQPPAAKPVAYLPLVILLLSASTLVLAFLYFMQNRRSGEQQSRILALESEQAVHQDSIAALNRQLDIIHDPNNLPVYITTDKDGKCQVIAAVYWNKVRKDNYLDIMALPPPPPGKQYQLWAIVKDDPAPKSMDPFNIPGMPRTLISAPYITDAPVAFAISLEPEGGSATPTEVIGIGYVTG